MSAFDYAIATTTTSTTTVAGGQSLLFTAAEVLAALVAIFVFGTLLTLVLTRAAKKAGASKPVTSSIRQWLAVLMIGSGIAAVASLTGISSQFTTLTLSGIAGLAFSLALQSTLSNVIAGILMLQEGVLRLGDEIEFGVVRGEVVKISLRSTWVKTDLGTIAVIGNSNLAAGPIMNHTARARLERKLQV
ncbi:MAG: mechanosensitive ion channel [archaeon]|nr:MAG: mechanosensitive ion channel [archaeon]